MIHKFTIILFFIWAGLSCASGGSEDGGTLRNSLNNLHPSYTPQSRTEPASPKELQAITQRGRMLAQYDAAAWYSSDALYPLKPDKSLLGYFIAKKEDLSWEVVFGNLINNDQSFQIAYTAKQMNTTNRFIITKNEPLKQSNDFYFKAAKAIKICATDFSQIPHHNRRYNVAVLPAEDNNFWVYLYPAPQKSNILPLGGDVRYLIDSNTYKIKERWRMHIRIMEVNYNLEEGKKAVMGVHTNLMDDAPEDTDVYYVLTRSPSIPQLIITQNFVYVIKENGGIKYISTVEEFKNRKKDTPLEF